MDISPYKNGIHSLAKGFENLDAFFINTSDVYLMKEVIIKLHHGLETLFKDILFQRNPVFLVDEKKDVKAVMQYYESYLDGPGRILFDEALTIKPLEAIKRIKSLRISTILTTQEHAELLKAFDLLNTLRNRLQHFGLKANSEEIIRIFGNLIPPAIKLLKSCYTPPANGHTRPTTADIPHTPLPETEDLFHSRGGRNIEADLNEIYAKSTQTIEHLTTNYNSLLQDTARVLKRKNVPSLKQSLVLKTIGKDTPTHSIYSMRLAGWINKELPAMWQVFPGSNDPSSGDGLCEGVIEVQEFEIIDRGNGPGFDAKVRFKIEASITLSASKAEPTFNIPDLNSHLTFLKSPTVTMKISLTCDTTSHLLSGSFQIQKVDAINGSLAISFSARLFGDTDPLVQAVQTLDLNKENTAIGLQSWLLSNDKLDPRYMLDLSIEGTESLIFS